MNGISSIYRRRIEDVKNFIIDHLDDQISLAVLAEVACFSPFHFHRIFKAIQGETVHAFVTRQKLQKAAKLLSYSARSIADISISCGFSSPAVFTRSFKSYFGTTPSQFKSNGEILNSKICKELYPIHSHLASQHNNASVTKRVVEVKKIQKWHVASIRIMDSFREGVVQKAYAKLIEFANMYNIFEQATFFGMSLDDIYTTPKNQYRYDACMTVPATLEIKNSELNHSMIPACQYAMTKVSGDISEVVDAMHYLYDHWLVRSTFEPAYLPGIEIFLNKEAICDWSHFELELCIPIKPI